MAIRFAVLVYDVWHLATKKHVGRRYEYFVIDRKRDQEFQVGFTVTNEEMRAFPSCRARWDSECMRTLWAGVREHSPETFADAWRAGWLGRDSYRDIINSLERTGVI